MNKKILITSIVVAVIIIASLAFFLMPKKAEDFNLILKSGDVNVLLKGEDWTKVIDTENEYKNLDSVETLDGEAVLTIMKSVIIDIEPNTNIAVKDIVNDSILLTSEEGKTWHKFLGLSGIESYEVQTPHTVASVRGTSFLIEITENRTKFILVEGELGFNNTEEEDTVDTLQKITFANDGSYKIEELTDEEKSEITIYSQETIEEMKNIRYRMINEYSNVVETIKKMTDTTDEELEQTLIDIDEGRIDEQELIDQSPIPLPDAIDELIELNKKIKEQKQILELLEGTDV